MINVIEHLIDIATVLYISNTEELVIDHTIQFKFPQSLGSERICSPLMYITNKMRPEPQFPNLIQPVIHKYDRIHPADSMIAAILFYKSPTSGDNTKNLKRMQAQTQLWMNVCAIDFFNTVDEYLIFNFDKSFSNAIIHIRFIRK